MDAQQREIWFPAKRYGWGWGVPIAWQGWVVLLAYFAALAIAGWLFLPLQRAMFIVVAAIATVLLIFVCWLKGEKPRWRWGGR